MEVLDAANNAMREIFHRCLDLILEFDIPDQQFWGPQFQGKTMLLAIITPCVTLGKHVTKTMTTYSQTTAQVITDLCTISSIIGWVWTRNRWGIIDKSKETSRTEFIPSNMEVFDLTGSDVTN